MTAISPQRSHALPQELATWRDSSQIRYDRAEAAEARVRVLEEALREYAAHLGPEGRRARAALAAAAAPLDQRSGREA